MQLLIKKSISSFLQSQLCSSYQQLPPSPYPSSKFSKQKEAQNQNIEEIVKKQMNKLHQEFLKGFKDENNSQNLKIHTLENQLIVQKQINKELELSINNILMKFENQNLSSTNLSQGKLLEKELENFQLSNVLDINESQLTKLEVANISMVENFEKFQKEIESSVEIKMENVFSSIKTRPSKQDMDNILKKMSSNLDQKLMHIFKQLNHKIVVSEKNIRALSKRKDQDRESLRFEFSRKIKEIQKMCKVNKNVDQKSNIFQEKAFSSFPNQQLQQQITHQLQQIRQELSSNESQLRNYLISTTNEQKSHIVQVNQKYIKLQQEFDLVQKQDNQHSVTDLYNQTNEIMQSLTFAEDTIQSILSVQEEFKKDLSAVKTLKNVGQISNNHNVKELENELFEVKFNQQMIQIQEMKEKLNQQITSIQQLKEQMDKLLFQQEFQDQNNMKTSTNVQNKQQQLNEKVSLIQDDLFQLKEQFDQLKQFERSDDQQKTKNQLESCEIECKKIKEKLICLKQSFDEKELKIEQNCSNLDQRISQKEKSLEENINQIEYLKLQVKDFKELSLRIDGMLVMQNKQQQQHEKMKAQFVKYKKIILKKSDEGLFNALDSQLAEETQVESKFEKEKNLIKDTSERKVVKNTEILQENVEYTQRTQLSDRKTKIQINNLNNPLNPLIQNPLPLTSYNSQYPLIQNNNQQCSLIQNQSSQCLLTQNKNLQCPLNQKKNPQCSLIQNQSSQCLLTQNKNLQCPLIQQKNPQCSLIQNKSAQCLLTQKQNSQCPLIQNKNLQCLLVQNKNQERVNNFSNPNTSRKQIWTNINHQYSNNCQLSSNYMINYQVQPNIPTFTYTPKQYPLPKSNTKRKRSNLRSYYKTTKSLVQPPTGILNQHAPLNSLNYKPFSPEDLDQIITRSKQKLQENFARKQPYYQPIQPIKTINPVEKQSYKQTFPSQIELQQVEDFELPTQKKIVNTTISQRQRVKKQISCLMNEEDQQYIAERVQNEVDKQIRQSTHRSTSKKDEFHVMTLDSVINSHLNSKEEQIQMIVQKQAQEIQKLIKDEISAPVSELNEIEDIIKRTSVQNQQLSNTIQQSINSNPQQEISKPNIFIEINNNDLGQSQLENVQENNDEDEEEEVLYLLDDEGYLMDENNNYILDENGETVKLSDEHIQYLKQSNMFEGNEQE